MRQRRNQLRGACYLHVLARILLLRSAGRLHRSFLDLTFTMSPPTDIQDDIEYEENDPFNRDADDVNTPLRPE